MPISANRLSPSLTPLPSLFGHVHLRDLGKLVAEQIEAAGGVAKEFNTIAVDDGIAMGHGVCSIHCHPAS